MKKKGQRHIPDFATKRPASPPSATNPHPTGSVAKTPAARQSVKPQATSAKSGRRGQ